MNEEELKDYYRWFLDILPTRIDILERSIKSTPGFESFNADFSVNSLEKIGQWAKKKLRKKFFRKSLTTESYSVAVDMGMYFAKTMINNLDGVKWHHSIDVRRNTADYGQPVLANFEPASCNPIRLLIVYCYDLVENKKTEKDLEKLFYIWKEMKV